MRERPANRSHPRMPSSSVRARAPRSTVLWRLHGATDDLRGLAIETSFGYALGLELDSELVLLHLQRNFDSLVAYAARLESALIKQGWKTVEEPQTERSSHASR
jgi:hypothetical protein